MKFRDASRNLLASNVAPHVGAWIEIEEVAPLASPSGVAPHVGAWIEITGTIENRRLSASHPTWVRGLKSQS